MTGILSHLSAGDDVTVGIKVGRGSTWSLTVGTLPTITLFRQYVIVIILLLL